MPSPKVIFSRAALTAFFLGHFALAGCAQSALNKLPEGIDLQLGGSGSAPGKFADLRDNTFDSQGNLWTLEGSTTREDGDGTYPGNSRVQVFDSGGGFMRQFPLGITAEPAHIAVDGQGSAYVSFPSLDQVVRYDRNGRRTAEFAVPNANGLTSYRSGNREIVAAIGGYAVGKGKSKAADRIYWLDDTDPLTGIELSRPLERVADLASDNNGNLYALADVNSIYVFGRDGKLKKTIGAGTASRAKDGSEVKASVAVGQNGEIYSVANTFLARFDADGEKVTRREGQFAWYDPWDTSVLSVDPSGRLWATTTTLVKNKAMERYHFRPAILRTSTDFFAAGSKGTTESSLASAGLTPRISSAAPLGVAFDLKPFRVDVAIPAANRSLESVDGVYRIYDAFKNVIAQGRFNVPLRDGETAKTSFNFTPPRYGAYSADVALESGGKTLTRLGANFGVTPTYSNLPGLSPELAFDPKVDGRRQMFAGLPALRLTVTANPKSWDALETTLAEGTRAGANIWVQFPDPKDATPEVVRAVAQRFKGRVQVYEIVNEPDIRMRANAYLGILRPAAQAIRQVDPQAQVMGPACVNIKLPWYEEFFQGGGADLVDIVSFHDYEGNESIDPVHWKAKIGALRDLMKRSGIGDKPLWQTERAIPAVRANTFLGLLQAIRINTHDDIMETLGIPLEHNLHYYLNESGYNSVPSYLWSEHGPHPAVFVTRTRYALTKGMRFAGTLEFGDGNNFLSGLRYSGPDGEVVALRTQNTRPMSVRFALSGRNQSAGNAIRIFDSWGNEQPVEVAAGGLTLELGQLPTYVRLPKGTGLTAAKLDFGRNIASQVRFGYTGETKSDFTLLTDGVLQTNHAGLPGSDNRGTTIWKGELPDPGIQSDDSSLRNPPALTMTFPNSRSVSTFVFYGLPSDNSFSALVAFDVQVRRGPNWENVAVVRRDDPSSEMVGIPPTLATSWASDTATFVVRLPQPVEAREWRLVPRRATFGVAYDAVAARAMKETATNTIKPALWLREVEIYGQ